MGLFSGISKAIKGITGALSGSSLFSSALGYLGQERANDMNMDIANMNNETAIELANTRYQRQVKDLAAAGLNPMLGYLKLDGGSTPNLQQAKVENSAAAASQAAMTSAQIRSANAQAEQSESQAELNSAIAERTKAEQIEIEARTPGHALSQDLTKAQTQAIGFVNAKVLADTDLTYEQTHFVKQQIRNAILTGENIKADTGNKLIDSTLKKADVILKQQQSYFNDLDTQRRVNESNYENSTYAREMAPYVNSAKGASSFDIPKAEFLKSYKSR